MAAILDTNHPTPDGDELRGTLDAEIVPHEILGPVVAGAFARGIVEAFELLGVPALFLDRAGHVLAVNGPAGGRLGSGLQVRSGHLLAKASKDNRVLADFVAAALRDPAARPSATLAAAKVTLRALPMPQRSTPAEQLLHAIVLLDRYGSDTPAAATGCTLGF